MISVSLTARSSVEYSSVQNCRDTRMVRRDNDNADARATYQRFFEQSENVIEEFLCLADSWE